MFVVESGVRTHLITQSVKLHANCRTSHVLLWHPPLSEFCLLPSTVSFLKYGTPFHPSFNTQLAIPCMSLSCVLTSLFRVFPWVYNTLGYNLLPVCSASWIALLFTGVLSTGFHMHEWGKTLMLGPQEIGGRMILPSSHISWFPIFVCIIVGEMTRSGVKPAGSCSIISGSLVFSIILSCQPWFL